MSAGATKPSQPAVAGDEAHHIAAKVRAEVENQAGKKSVWEPVEYSTQLVNGTNYFIKVKTGDNEAVHLRVWKGFQDADLSALQLHSIKQGKSLSDALVYF